MNKAEFDLRDPCQRVFNRFFGRLPVFKLLQLSDVKRLHKLWCDTRYIDMRLLSSSLVRYVWRRWLELPAEEGFWDGQEGVRNRAGTAERSIYAGFVSRRWLRERWDWCLTMQAQQYMEKLLQRVRTAHESWDEIGKLRGRFILGQADSDVLSTVPAMRDFMPLSVGVGIFLAQQVCKKANEYWCSIRWGGQGAEFWRELLVGAEKRGMLAAVLDLRCTGDFRSKFSSERVGHVKKLEKRAKLSRRVDAAAEDAHYLGGAGDLQLMKSFMRLHSAQMELGGPCLRLVHWSLLIWCFAAMPQVHWRVIVRRWRPGELWRPLLSRWG